jgi:hypothetical protein
VNGLASPGLIIFILISNLVVSADKLDAILFCCFAVCPLFLNGFIT